MTNTIFDKTDKGREEIATRKFQLAPRLRTLLVLVDGKQPAEELLKKVAGIGLTEASIGELLENGFIQPAASLSEKADAADVTPAEAPADTPASDAQGQFQAAYQFYTQTIKSTIGLRGYALQLKVEKAASIDDFRALRQPYLEAVLKAQGEEVARNLQRQLDQLLYASGPAPDSATPGPAVAQSS